MIRFGPAGIGAAHETESTFKKYREFGIQAAEIPFTYGVYIKEEQLARKIGRDAKNNDIKLSIHAPYWINLNSEDRKKIEESKMRIINSCRVANWLGAKIVVFHAGFYGKKDKETGYQNIKKAVVEILEKIRENNWKVKIAVETMGKKNVFGSLDEVLRLVNETGCSFCIDFAHLSARSNGEMSYSDMCSQVKDFSELHCHFSGIEFGEKGEKHHKLTDKNELRKLISSLPRNKDITVINESPLPVEDSVSALKIYSEV